MPTKPRGRPPKFGRPSRLVAMTLPEDVLSWLKSIDPDPARAVVGLYERGSAGERPAPREPHLVEIVLLAGRRGLIAVDRQVFGGLPGVDLLPLDGGRAFLALAPDADLTDLELTVADRLDEAEAGPERQALSALRERLREWRRDPTWRFRPRAIIVAERQPARRRR